MPRDDMRHGHVFGRSPAAITRNERSSVKLRDQFDNTHLRQIRDEVRTAATRNPATYLNTKLGRNDLDLTAMAAARGAGDPQGDAARVLSNYFNNYQATELSHLEGQLAGVRTQVQLLDPVYQQDSRSGLRLEHNQVQDEIQTLEKNQVDNYLLSSLDRINQIVPGTPVFEALRTVIGSEAQTHEFLEMERQSINDIAKKQKENREKFYADLTDIYFKEMLLAENSNVIDEVIRTQKWHPAAGGVAFANMTKEQKIEEGIKIIKSKREYDLGGDTKIAIYQDGKTMFEPISADKFFKLGGYGPIDNERIKNYVDGILAEREADPATKGKKDITINIRGKNPGKYNAYNNNTRKALMAIMSELDKRGYNVNTNYAPKGEGLVDTILRNNYKTQFEDFKKTLRHGQPHETEKQDERIRRADELALHTGNVQGSNAIFNASQRIPGLLAEIKRVEGQITRFNDATPDGDFQNKLLELNNLTGQLNTVLTNAQNGVQTILHRRPSVSDANRLKIYNLEEHTQINDARNCVTRIENHLNTLDGARPGARPFLRAEINNLRNRIAGLNDFAVRGTGQAARIDAFIPVVHRPRGP